MHDALLDYFGNQPFEIIPPQKLALSGSPYGIVPAAVAAAIGTNPLVDPIGGSPAGNYTATAGTLTGGNTTLGLGITRFDIVTGRVRQTLLAIRGLVLTLPSATGYLATEIFDFPKGYIGSSAKGVRMDLALTTTSVLSSTLNSGSTVHCALGSVTASATTLSSTMVDWCPSTDFTSSTTINVPSATINGVLAAAAQFDGTTTASKIFLNIACASGLSANATLALDGFIQIDWDWLGQKRLVNGA